jgi:hypothetical protein
MSMHKHLSSDASAWHPFASGEAELKLSSASGRVPALQMDFDFKGGGGFAVARRVVKRTMPEDYMLSLRLRGRGAVNDLELKLVDVTGQNVWRHVKKSLSPAARWRNLKVPSREMEFAWGPAGGGVMKELGAIEIAIVAGTGGAGTVWIADLDIEDCAPNAAPKVDASSEQPGYAAVNALSGGGWKPDPADSKPWIVIDSIEPRRLGGLIIDWLDGAPASGFVVRGSMSRRRWKTLYTARHCGGARSYVYLPYTELRFLRLELSERNRSNSRARSMPSGTTSRSANRAAGIRAGCIASRATGPPSASQTARNANS